MTGARSAFGPSRRRLSGAHWLGRDPTASYPGRPKYLARFTTRVLSPLEASWSLGEGSFLGRQEGPAGTTGNFMSIKQWIAGVSSTSQKVSVDLASFRPWASTLRHLRPLMVLCGGF